MLKKKKRKFHMGLLNLTGTGIKERTHKYTKPIRRKR